MSDLSLETLNAYCQDHFQGNFGCETVEGKGRIMVAKRSFSQGEVMFVESPLLIVQEEEDNEAFLMVKSLCEEENEDDIDFDHGPLWYWAALCSLTKEQLKKGPKFGSLRPIDGEQQRLLLCLYHEPVEESTEAVQAIVKRLGLKVSPVLVEELLQAWILNCFEHSDDPQGFSAYFASSMANHSCYPNAIWSEADDGKHLVRARENIAKGDEVTISYLDETDLLKPVRVRKRILQETKLFECTCKRCAASSSEDRTLCASADMSRGFVCKHCGECAVFLPLNSELARSSSKGKGKGKLDALAGVKCQACGATVENNEGRRLLQAEAALEGKLRHLDEQVEERGLDRVLEQDRARSLLKLVASGSAGPIGPQHWLCDRLWNHLHKWYGLENRREEQRQLLQLRVEYQRKAYPGLSGSLAWTLEEQADVLMRHIGFGSKMLDGDRQFEDELVAQVGPIFEESMHMLHLMFGGESEHYTQVKRKRALALVFFDRRRQMVAEKPVSCCPAG